MNSHAVSAAVVNVDKMFSNMKYPNFASVRLICLFSHGAVVNMIGTIYGRLAGYYLVLGH